MTDVMEQFKIPGYKLKKRTFIVTDRESVQARLDIGLVVAIDKSTSLPGQTRNTSEE